jgi:hypothetical protein
VPVEPPAAHLLGIPLEELLPALAGLGTLLTYARLALSPRRNEPRLLPSAASNATS